MKKFLISIIALFTFGLAHAGDFGSSSGKGEHVVIGAGGTASFAFTPPAGATTADIKFSDNPQTIDRTARLTVKLSKAGVLLATRPVNYSRVRTESFVIVPGQRYTFTVTSQQAIAFAVTMQYPKAKAERPAPPKRG